MSLQLRPQMLISSLVMLLAASALGFALGMATVERADASSHIGVLPPDAEDFTYSDSSCTAGNEKDPINVVFTNHGIPDAVLAGVLSHPGWWSQGGTQYFGDQEGCHASDGSPASNDGLWPHSGRYHMRNYNLEAAGGGIRTVPPFGSISLAAAHHEDRVTCTTEDFPYINPNAHAVDDDLEEVFIDVFGEPVFGGFNAGREDIWKNWVWNADHVVERVQFWGNMGTKDQCNGNQASSDGWVYYIRTFEPDPDDTDADGCDNVKENGSDPTEGGLRDPADPWDYYDVSLPKDGHIDLFHDIMGVIAHQSLDGSPPYDAYYDRGPQPVGADHWKKTAPDGSINLFTDILGVIAQFGHDCT